MVPIGRQCIVARHGSINGMECHVPTGRDMALQCSTVRYTAVRFDQWNGMPCADCSTVRSTLRYG